MYVINSLLVMIPILVSVAFYTSTERKILSYIQLRKGPNKPSMMGVLVPFADAIKLFNKTFFLPHASNTLLAFTSPCVIFALSIIMWPLLPLQYFGILDSPVNTLIILLISSIAVYFSILTGWATNCKYSHLGAIRSAAQMVSYEINFFSIIFFIMMILHSFSLNKSHSPPIIIGSLPLFIMWLCTITAEVNRSPFDFAEAESELVSGFNVEYMGGLFALIFLAEYTNMLFLSTLTSIIFLNTFLIISTPLIAFSLLWMRGTLPRLRFDLLMKLNWQIMMPIILPLMFPFIVFIYYYF